MITYRGVELQFGKHSGSLTEREVKVIAFPAVNGTEEMDFGKRQKTITVTGLMTDIENGPLTPVIIESWNDTSSGSLVVHGVTYSNCRVKGSWDTVQKDAVTNKITARYNLQFRKLK